MGRAGIIEQVEYAGMRWACNTKYVQYLVLYTTEIAM